MLQITKNIFQIPSSKKRMHFIFSQYRVVLF